MKKNKLILLVVLNFLFLGGCVEELDIESLGPDQDKAPLVVEATFTDEIKRQRLYLSRAETRLDLVTDTSYVPYLVPGVRPRDSVNVETNAVVRLVGSNGSIWPFSEPQPGIYRSLEEFGLQLNVDYTLEINTSDGGSYESYPLRITEKAELNKVEPRIFMEDDGTEGIAIYVSGSSSIGNPTNIRYTYEETYKIIAPKWNPKNFELMNYDPCGIPQPTYDLEIVDREVQNRVCFNTILSNSVNLVNTANELGGNVSDYRLRFIRKDNFIISYRYSILVRQYVQSPDAFSFYSALQDYSESQNVFSQIQPGTLKANVISLDNPDEIILGYVEAASVSEKRIFFNYDDFYLNEELPPFPFNCADRSSPESHISYCSIDPHSASPCPLSIIENVHHNLISYTGPNESGVGSCPGPYIYVPRVCGDCTLLGNNTPPEFWTE